MENKKVRKRERERSKGSQRVKGIQRMLERKQEKVRERMEDEDNERKRG